MAFRVQAIKVQNMIKMFGKAIRVNKASQDKNSQEVGANLFIGNLDPDVDEKVGMVLFCLQNLLVRHMHFATAGHGQLQGSKIAASLKGHFSSSSCILCG
jgi:hypothetical protein